MENNGFKKYAKAWNKADLAARSQKVYSEKEIKNIKMKTSQDFSKTINNSIVFDYVHKGILILGMFLLVGFYRTSTPILIVLFALIALSILLIYKEFRIQKQLKRSDDFTKELSDVIRLKLQFYKEKITPLKLMLAFTNSLFVWVGSMFYFYSKYGYYKIDDIDDKVVAFLMVAVAFVGSYMISNWHLNVKVMELEDSLENLDDTESATLQLQLWKRKKRRQKIMMIIFGIVGFLLFAFLTITYLMQIF